MKTATDKAYNLITDEYKAYEIWEILDECKLESKIEGLVPDLGDDEFTEFMDEIDLVELRGRLRDYIRQKENESYECVSLENLGMRLEDF